MTETLFYKFFRIYNELFQQVHHALVQVQTVPYIIYTIHKVKTVNEATIKYAPGTGGCQLYHRHCAHVALLAVSFCYALSRTAIWLLLQSCTLPSTQHSVYPFWS